MHTDVAPLSPTLSPTLCSTASPHLFQSFWMGGFESSCHINRRGRRLDMIAATQHDLQAGHDYALLRSVGIMTARDAVRWHLVERAGQYDFSSLEPLLKASQRHGVEVIWDLCHYGWPDDLDVFSPTFVERFARFCGAVARFLKDHSETAPSYTPINEISFLAWAAGQVGYFHPFAKGRGNALKRQLIRAAIAGSEAIWAADPRAKMVTAEPVIHVVPPRGKARYAGAAARKRASQFEAWDMLAGRASPELGGHPRYLGAIGVNFYHDNQWQHPGARRLGWDGKPCDDRWLPFHRLLLEVWERYRRPLFVAETSHFGAGRADWLRHIAAEVYEARLLGVPLLGVCLYPILDRPDWDKPRHWHNSGLWDLRREADGRLERVLVQDYAAELQRAQTLLGQAALPASKEGELQP